MKRYPRTSSHAPFVAGFVACLLASAAPADVIQIDAFDRGDFTATGRHIESLERTITGYLFNTQRSFYAFDLASISGMMVTSATLVLQVVSYEGPLDGHQFGVYDVSSSISNLLVSSASGSSTGLAIFADLGTGDFYSSGVVPFFMPFGIPPPDRVLPLSPAALEDLSAAAGGLFAVGVHVSTAPGPTASYVSFSDDTQFDPGPWRHYLVLETKPAPLRVSAMNITNDVIALEFSGMPVGSTVAVQRTVAILNGWDHVESLQPTSTTTNWSEPWDSRVHALYRLRKQ